MNDQKTMELSAIDDRELLDVVGGGCHPCRCECGPEIAVAVAVAVAIAF
jgi:natural product precursor